MRILVSGGTGYVGSYLVPALEHEGHEVALLARRELESISCSKVVLYDGLVPLSEFCQAWRPQIVIHMAADVAKGCQSEQIDGLAAANLILPLHMVSAANDSGAEFFVNITTFSTSSDTVDYFPQTLYAATKKACENLLMYYHQSENIKVCNLVFYDIYGPKQPHSRFLTAAIDAVLNQNPFSMTKGEQDICFLHVFDAVDAIIHCVKEYKMLKECNRNTFCVHGPEVFLLKTVVARIAGALGVPCPDVSYDRNYRKNEIMRFLPRYPLLVDWAPHVGFDAGIKNIAQGVN